MKKLAFFLILLAIAVSGGNPQPDTRDVVKKIVDRAVENDKALDKYGFFQKIVTKKFDSDNALKTQEVRTYQTVWIENKPYMELLKVNDRPPNESQKKEEAKHRQNFVDSIHGKKPAKDSDDFDLGWNDLFQKYDFTTLPKDGTSDLVLHFEPRKGDLQERSKVERIFNNVSGTVWADDQYDLLKAQTSLIGTVKFGLGLVAKIDKLEIVYSQKHFENVCMPEHFNMKFNVRIALLKTANQEVDMTFSDYFHRPSS